MEDTRTVTISYNQYQKEKKFTTDKLKELIAMRRLLHNFVLIDSKTGELVYEGARNMTKEDCIRYIGDTISGTVGW